MALRHSLFASENNDISNFLAGIAKLPSNDLNTFRQNIGLFQLPRFLENDKDGNLFKALILFFCPEERLAFLKYASGLIEAHHFVAWQNGLEWILLQLPLEHRSLFLAEIPPVALNNLLKMRHYNSEEYHGRIVRALLLLEPNAARDVVIDIFVNRAGTRSEFTQDKLHRILAAKLSNVKSMAWVLRLLPFDKRAVEQIDVVTLQALVTSPEQLGFILHQSKESSTLILQKLGEVFVIKLLPSWKEYQEALEFPAAKNALIHFLPIHYLISIQPDYRTLYVVLKQHHSEFLPQIVKAIGAKRIGESIHSFDDLCSYLNVLEDEMAREVVKVVFARGIALLPEALPELGGLPWSDSSYEACGYIERLILVLKQASPQQLGAYRLTQSCLMQLSPESLMRILPVINCPKQCKALQEAHAERWLQHVMNLPIDQEDDLARSAYLNTFSAQQLQEIATTVPTWHLYQLCCRLEKTRLNNLVKRSAGEIDMPVFFHSLLKMRQENLEHAERFILACLEALNPYPLKPMKLTELRELMKSLPTDMQKKLLMQLDFTKLTLQANDIDLFLLTIDTSLRFNFLTKILDRLEIKTGAELVSIKRCLPQELQAAFLKTYQTIFGLLHQKMSVEDFAKKAATFQDGGVELAGFIKGLADEHARYHQHPSPI